MMADKPLLLGALLKCMSAIAVMLLFPTDCYVDIEIEGDVENGKDRQRSYHSVRLYVDGREVLKSTDPKHRASALKWEWNPGIQMWVMVL